ncbi:hypothetical protein FRC12_001605 [Ceratobasidium sp. 428]|nr:hypothetical protein FRC12_001605 [Ceratobasidium sp. 428]
MMQAAMNPRAADGSVHLQYSNHPHYAHAPIPIPMHSHTHAHSHQTHSMHSYNQHQSLTSYGAKPQAEASYLSTPMSHSYSASSLMHPPAPFGSSLPTSLSAPIPIRRHTLPHIAYPEYGHEDHDDAHSQSYEGSIQSPASVQSPNDRAFSEGEYDAPSSYSHNGMTSPFRGAAAVIEPPYHVHQPRGHAQEGSDGSNSGWRTVAANVIDWSGRAHGGGHSRDSSSGSNASNMSNATAIGEPQHSVIPYAPPMARSHPDYPVTPRSGVPGSSY